MANPALVKLDYYARDYPTVLQSILAFLKANYPEKWSDFQDSNAGMELAQLNAYVYAIQSWNIDRSANEAFLPSATQRKNVLRIADELGYASRGIVASVLLADAALVSPLTGPSSAVLQKGARIKSTQGLSFEVREDTPIELGNTTPRIQIATQANTTPVNSQVDFVSGSSEIIFSDLGGGRRLAPTVAAGMWLSSTTGIYTDWYRIQSVAADSSSLQLTTPWNSAFTMPFMIRTAADDVSPIIVSSVPYGTFQATATAVINSDTIEFTRALPDTVIAGQYFRMNSTNAQANAFFLISAISKDRKSVTINTVYAPLTAGGFDSKSSNFSVEQRGVALIQGESRTEEFVSTETADQQYTLGETAIILNAIQVYDEDGETDGSGNPLPWAQVTNLTLAVGDNLRSYRVRLLDQDMVRIEFGDGVIGQIPTGKITIDYRVGDGTSGDVPKNSFNTSVAALQGAIGVSVKVTNPETTGVGGLDSESIDELRTNIPAHLATNQRGVLASDYDTLITVDYPKNPGAVGSVFIVSVSNLQNQVPYGGNFIYIYCWTRETWRPPSSQSPADVFYYRYVPIPSILQASVQDFVDIYKMMTDTPLILKGTIDEAIIQVDVQTDLAADPAERQQACEAAIIDLFNSQRVVDRQPVLVSDVYHALEDLSGILQSKLRKMYLDIYNSTAPGSLDDTPVTLQTVGNLYPRNPTDVVVPGDIKVNVWNREQALNLYLEGRLYGWNFSTPDTTLAQESIHRAVEAYFFSLSPGQAISALDLAAIINVTVAGGTAQHLADVAVASTVNVADIANTLVSVVPPTIDGRLLQTGDRVLLKNQTTAKENGVYLFTFDGVTPWSLTRTVDANSYFTLLAGSYVFVRTGTVNVSTWWYFATGGLNAVTFTDGAKSFLSGGLDAASALIKVTVGGISDFTLRFDSPVGNDPSQFSKDGVPYTVFTLKSLQIAQL